jgi:hypothetical protein
MIAIRLLLQHLLHELAGKRVAQMTRILFEFRKQD